METIYKANIAILISGNVDFSTGSTPSNKLGYFIKTNELIHQEDTTILIVNAPNNKASKPQSKTWRNKRKKYTKPQ